MAKLTDQELTRLIEARKTKNPNHFAGDIDEATLQALEELQDLRLAVADFLDGLRLSA